MNNKDIVTVGLFYIRQKKNVCIVCGYRLLIFNIEIIQKNPYSETDLSLSA